jgi:tRNA pseudouridine38-40 synthase
LEEEEEEPAGRNIRVILAYDGTEFCGWQRQRGATTVQEAVEAKLERITGETVRVVAAGRTDAGVHATGQVINFRTRGRIPTERVAAAMNSIPPFTVVARHAREVPNSFHARYDAVRRTYRYYLLCAGPSPFLSRYTCPAPELTGQGLERMRQALQQLAGRHDFTSFSAADLEARPRVRTLYTASLRQRGPIQVLSFTADGFLRGMVRAIVGTLLEIATGRRRVEDVASILAAQDRRAAGESAPPRGLFLARVEYPAAPVE